MRKFDATNALVFGTIVLLIAAASWQLIGSFVLWAAWQVFLYYVLLVTVAALLFLGLHVAFGGEE